MLYKPSSHGSTKLCSPISCSLNPILELNHKSLLIHLQHLYTIYTIVHPPHNARLKLPHLHPTNPLAHAHKILPAPPINPTQFPEREIYPLHPILNPLHLRIPVGLAWRFSTLFAHDRRRHVFCSQQQRALERVFQGVFPWKLAREQWCR